MSHYIIGTGNYKLRSFERKYTPGFFSEKGKLSREFLIFLHQAYSGPLFNYY
jgi:hypothetical protein